MDVIRNKIEIIERCLQRVREVYNSNPENLHDVTKQDSIILNLQRAIEASIDLAMHIVSMERLGLPQSSRDAFEMLHQKRIIDTNLLAKMNAMVGFRNIAVHNYQKIDLVILQNIVEEHLADFSDFVDAIKKWA